MGLVSGCVSIGNRRLCRTGVLRSAPARRRIDRGDKSPHLDPLEFGRRVRFSEYRDPLAGSEIRFRDLGLTFLIAKSVFLIVNSIFRLAKPLG